MKIDEIVREILYAINIINTSNKTEIEKLNLLAIGLVNSINLINQRLNDLGYVPK